MARRSSVFMIGVVFMGHRGVGACAYLAASAYRRRTGCTGFLPAVIQAIPWGCRYTKRHEPSA